MSAAVEPRGIAARVQTGFEGRGERPIEHLLEIAWLDLIDPRTTAGAVSYGALILVLTLGATRLTGVVAHRALKGEGLSFDPNTRRFVIEILQVSVVVLGLIIYAHLVPALHKLANALLASASIFSLVMGIAAQPTLGNLIAGLALVIYRPFAIGDRMEFAIGGGPRTVTVQSFSLGHTRLVTDEGQVIVVPNTTMFSSVVTLVGAVSRPSAAQTKPRASRRNRKT